MIVDCFTFSDELDLLELRLRVLEDVVDRFVVCEAPFTFRGRPKPLHFAALASERFARWRDRITALAYPGPPDADPWRNEWAQRDFLATALTDCAADDVILIGDCDEIPDPRNVTRRPAADGILVHRMMMSQGYVNRVTAEGACVWNGTRAILPAALARYGSLSEVRKANADALGRVEGGWHFTSLGGAEAMERKLGSYSHVELDIPYFRDRRRLEAAYASTGECVWVPLDGRFPPALRDDPRWRELVWERPAAGGAPAGLEHAHGALAYVPAGATRVAVLASEPTAWETAGRERLGGAFAGIYPSAAALRAASPDADWIVVDGLERRPPGELGQLAGSRASLVAFAANARSLEVFRRVMDGSGGFPPGRALGRAEHEAHIAAAGFRVVTAERVFSRKLALPLTDVPLQNAVIDGFAFAEIAAGALHDFLSDAFLFTLAPAAEH